MSHILKVKNCTTFTFLHKLYMELCSGRNKKANNIFMIRKKKKKKNSENHLT